MILNKQQIIAVNDLTIETMEVPEWGGSVCIRGMTGAERDTFESSIVTMKGQKTNVNMKDIRARLASLSICDETGQRLFSETEIHILGKKSAIALQRIFKVAQRLSGIGEQEVQELVEGLQENPLENSASA